MKIATISRGTGNKIVEFFSEIIIVEIYNPWVRWIWILLRFQLTICIFGRIFGYVWLKKEKNHKSLLLVWYQLDVIEEWNLMIWSSEFGDIEAASPPETVLSRKRPPWLWLLLSSTSFCCYWHYDHHNNHQSTSWLFCDPGKKLSWELSMLASLRRLRSPK